MRKVDTKSCSDISQFQAELGRSRQDELPLSNQAKRPTYLPGRSGTSHIPQARKEKLESKWGGKSMKRWYQSLVISDHIKSKLWTKRVSKWKALSLAMLVLGLH